MKNLSAAIVLGALCASADALGAKNTAASPFPAGADLLPVFQRAAAGAPLRTVLIGVTYPPEATGGAVEWKPLSGDGGTVDFAALTGHGDRGVSYVRTTIESASERDVVLGVGLATYEFRHPAASR